MAAPRIMNRLLLGDAGTGKTAVAAVVLLQQQILSTSGSCMAPTSVLAPVRAQKIGPLFTLRELRGRLLLYQKRRGDD